jgi:hypothetical protein
MKLRLAAPKDGVQWMLGGVRLVRREPLALAGLFGLMIFGLGLVLGLPWVGPVLVGMLLPALTAGWVDTAAAMQAGERPAPQHLFGPLRNAAIRPALIRLGGWHALCSLLMLLLAELLDAGMNTAWDTLRDSDSSNEATLEAIATLQRGMVLRAALLLPVVLTFWHAPVIVARTGMDAGKALFISANASWRNLGAFVVYGLCWVGADLVLSLLLGGLLGALGLGQAALLLVLPGALLFSAAFYASLQGTTEGCIDFSD